MKNINNLKDINTMIETIKRNNLRNTRHVTLKEF